MESMSVKVRLWRLQRVSALRGVTAVSAPSNAGGLRKLLKEIDCAASVARKRRLTNDLPFVVYDLRFRFKGSACTADAIAICCDVRSNFSHL